MDTAPLLPALGFLGSISHWEILLVALLGLLIFGKRLPEVGRSIGRGIVEFKRGLSGFEEEVKGGGEPPRIEPAQQDGGEAEAGPRDQAKTGPSSSSS